MTDSDVNGYINRLMEVDSEIASIIGSFESIQENLQLGRVEESQTRMVAEIGGRLRRLDKEFAPLEPPDNAMHAKLCEALTELGRAYNLFMTRLNSQWTVAFLQSRHSFCRSLYLLYELRGALPLTDAHLLMPGMQTPASGQYAAGGPATGFIHRERTQEHSRYTLFVPEHYSAAKSWPLIVCLHGGYGDGFDYIWTWLRPGRSYGYFLLAPKSLDVTWGMTLGSPDTRSVLAMVREVSQQYAVDPARVYLTGLSDGGIFTYILGLEQHQLFAALAPIAGALHPVVDPILREGRGKELPMLVIHGVHDFIFPVAFTRQTCRLLKDLGYQVQYEELPDWGHAFPYSINERLVLPWFQERGRPGGVS